MHEYNEVLMISGPELKTHQEETKVKLQFKLRHNDKQTVFIHF